MLPKKVICKGRIIPLESRRKNLKELLAYAKKHSFNPSLIEDWESQLKILDQRIKELKGG